MKSPLVTAQWFRIVAAECNPPTQPNSMLLLDGDRRPDRDALHEGLAADELDLDPR